MENERPLVAIVGRPNVGKSSLFNRVMGTRMAIVEPTAGVTRDRLMMPVSMDNPRLEFDLMDTGGIGIVDDHNLGDSIEYQVMAGLEAASIVLFLVDAREGLTLLDERVASLLRKANRPVKLFANKCEGRAAESTLDEFLSLGLGEPVPLSAQEGRGMSNLYELLLGSLPAAEEVPPAHDGALRLAVLGRRNTGKSSFINKLVGEQRVIVSDIPGTTRDAVEVDFEWKGEPVRLVDTAGVHKRSKLASAVEFFSLTRSDQAIRRADVSLLFLDLTQLPARLDQELGRTINDRYKPVVVVGTKSDLVPDMTVRSFRDWISGKLPHLSRAPLHLISNTEGKGLGLVMTSVFKLREESSRRVSTADFNKALISAFSRLRFRGRGEKPQAFYGTQIKIQPPTFLLFVNRKRLYEKEVMRAVSRELCSQLGFKKVPIRLVLRERKRSPSKRG